VSCPVGQSFSLKPYDDKKVHNLFVALRNRRVELGLSQKRLSYLLGVDISSLARWETGVQSPTALMLLDWCQSLGLGFNLLPLEQ